jgi:hypothetical protein
MVCSKMISDLCADVDEQVRVDTFLPEMSRLSESTVFTIRKVGDVMCDHSFIVFTLVVVKR